MEENVGKVDKMIRFAVGIVLAVIGFYAHWWWLYIIAIIPVLTGMFNYCPLYTLLKINTNK
ncbi:MAG: DUF2892 domain-containing protein [Nanoarchaeota archaeon]|nr:DUF2892 domain-containing protein [Nanoarchaeota archaeon]